MTFGLMILGLMTFSQMTFVLMILGLMTFSQMTFGLMILGLLTFGLMTSSLMAFDLLTYCPFTTGSDGGGQPGEHHGQQDLRRHLEGGAALHHAEGRGSIIK